MFSMVSQFFVSGGEARRIAVIDVGSNSVRMVVFLAEARIPAVLFNEKALCGLGEELEATGRLSTRGKELAWAALARFAELAERMSVDAAIAIGTAALREAADGPEFVRETAARSGLDIEIASGAEEARLAAQGVLVGDPQADGLAADLGGASLELVRLQAASSTPVGAGVSTPLGALRVRSQLEEAARSKVVDRVDETLRGALDQLDLAATPPKTLYALGGSFRAFANAWMEIKGYPLRVLQGYELTLAEALEAAEWLSKTRPSDLRQISGVSERRAAVTPAACLVLWRLLERARPERLSISAFGLREGAYWERLGPTLRAADPLLSAAHEIEQRQARAPGFGQELFDWLKPALKDFSDEETRLAHVACLISDAGWRTHPDYRALTVLELVTRNAFGGVDHPGRVFILAALLNRYKGGRKVARVEPALGLIDADRRARAAALGRGMRLGAAIAGAAPGMLPRLELAFDGRALTLSTKKGVALLGGEDVARRLAAFAEAFGVEASIIET